MICSRCGAEIPENSRYCLQCGEPVGLDQKVDDSLNKMADGAQDVFRDAESSLRSELVDIRNTFNNTRSVKLKSDRNILVYVILSMITCGIYGYFYIYRMAQDVNIACAGDGDETPGLVAFILLSIITCGFYSWYWYYRLGNRLAMNAPRYGMSFMENGTSVLLWCIFGILICGIGPFVGMYILTKNTNLICDAYNRAHGLV